MRATYFKSSLLGAKIMLWKKMFPRYFLILRWTGQQCMPPPIWPPPFILDISNIIAWRNFILVQRKTWKKSEKLQQQKWPFILDRCMRKHLFQKNENICSSYWLHVPSLYHEEISVLSKRKMEKILRKKQCRELNNLLDV